LVARQVDKDVVAAGVPEYGDRRFGQCRDEIRDDGVRIRAREGLFTDPDADGGRDPLDRGAAAAPAMRRQADEPDVDSRTDPLAVDAGDRVGEPGDQFELAVGEVVFEDVNVEMRHGVPPWLLASVVAGRVVRSRR
jgi:hypothetical protein